MNRSDAILLARELRKRQTPQEAMMWNILRNRNFQNLKFSRQKPIFYSDMKPVSRYFIVDFYCEEYKLILEIDGGYHARYKQHDKERSEILAIYENTVLRFTNYEVENNLEMVLSKISIKIEELSKKEKDKT